MKTLVSASILSADFGCLANELSRAKDSGCDMIHFDVMDGHFVPNISYGIPVLKSIKKYSALPMDVHLMISEPLKYIVQDHRCNTCPRTEGGDIGKAEHTGEQCISVA